MTPDKIPVVIIVGGGFGGLAAARSLKGTLVNVLIDRTNHHLFQPLLYQVATSILAPGQISSPIRGILQSSSNSTVILGNVTGVDRVAKHVIVDGRDRVAVPVSYDYLILAAG